MATPEQIKAASSTKQAVLDIIYNKVNGMLGGGPTGQLFCMEFPARPLNYHQYEYDTESRTSVVSKPFSISDSEFRLTDDLFNVAPIVQGPNGKKLSVTYSEAINNYVPRLKELHDFITDKGNIRDWLMAEVHDNINGEDIKQSRMELCKRLYNAYLEAKEKWDAEKSTQYNSLKASNELDDFADWLSRKAMVKDQELNNLFNDCVVRGYLHEVLTFLGFLNVCSSSEALETTKQNARNSSRRSMDESMDILPVQLQPSNWFQAMKPNFSPKDLTMAADMVLAQYQAKQQELAQLRSQVTLLKANMVTEDDVKSAAAAVESGRVAYRNAEEGLIKTNGDNAVSLFKVYLNAQTSGIFSKIKAIGNIDLNTDALAKKLNLAESMSQEVANTMLASYKQQANYLDSVEKLAQLRARYADSSAHDYQAEITRINDRINNLQADMRYLETLAGGVFAPANQPKGLDEGKVEAAPVLPDNKSDPVADGMFMDVVIDQKSAADAAKATSDSQSISSNFKVGLWFGSVGHQSSSDSAASSVETAALSKEFTIGFRVAKVGIDRGGWFNPTIFEMSSGFQRIAKGIRPSPGPGDAPLNKGTIAKAVEEESTAPGSLDTLLKTKADKIPYVLPAYPVAFVIAKDITIRVQQASSDSSMQKAMAESSSSTGGGILCFSANSATSSKSTAESAYHGSQSDYYYIRIPGPQIIGWMLQLTPSDQSMDYAPLDNETLGQLRAGITKALAPVKTDAPPPAN